MVRVVLYFVFVVPHVVAQHDSTQSPSKSRYDKMLRLMLQVVQNSISVLSTRREDGANNHGAKFCIVELYRDVRCHNGGFKLIKGRCHNQGLT